LQIIYNKLKDLNPAQGFGPGTRPFIYQQVVDVGEFSKWIIKFMIKTA